LALEVDILGMEEQLPKKKKFLAKALVAILGLLIVALAAYIFGLPFYPEIKYQLLGKQQSEEFNQIALEQKNSELSQAQNATTSAPAVGERKGNFLIIPKIGVDIPIIDSDNSRWALNQGAWRMPETSTPDKGGNTAIAGHRFKYLPPNNLTFYLLDKLVQGDTFEIIWSGKSYIYQVSETKIVPPTEVSVLNQTEKSIVTLITCDPIFTQKNRLIVIGELVTQ